MRDGPSKHGDGRGNARRGSCLGSSIAGGGVVPGAGGVFRASPRGATGPASCHACRKPNARPRLSVGSPLQKFASVADRFPGVPWAASIRVIMMASHIGRPPPGGVMAAISGCGTRAAPSPLVAPSLGHLMLRTEWRMQPEWLRVVKRLWVRHTRGLRQPALVDLRGGAQPCKLVRHERARTRVDSSVILAEQVQLRCRQAAPGLQASSWEVPRRRRRARSATEGHRLLPVDERRSSADLGSFRRCRVWYSVRRHRWCRHDGAGAPSSRRHDGAGAPCSRHVAVVLEPAYGGRPGPLRRTASGMRHWAG